MIFSLCPTTALVYVNFTRFVRNKVFLVTRSNIEGQGNNAHKTKSYVQAITFYEHLGLR